MIHEAMRFAREEAFSFWGGERGWLNFPLLHDPEHDELGSSPIVGL